MIKIIIQAVSKIKSQKHFIFFPNWFSSTALRGIALIEYHKNDINIVSIINAQIMTDNDQNCYDIYKQNNIIIIGGFSKYPSSTAIETDDLGTMII